MCDDMFVYRPVTFQDFFGRMGGRYVPLIRFGWAILPIRRNTAPWHQARLNNFILLKRIFGESKFGRISRNRDISHQAKALTKTGFIEAARHPKISPQWNRTSYSRFRNTRDLEPVGLVSHMLLLKGQAMHKPITKLYIGITDKSTMRNIKRLVANRSCKLLCLNDDMSSPSPRFLQEYHQFITTLPNTNYKFDASSNTANRRRRNLNGRRKYTGNRVPYRKRNSGS